MKNWKKEGDFQSIKSLIKVNQAKPKSDKPLRMAKIEYTNTSDQKNIIKIEIWGAYSFQENALSQFHFYIWNPTQSAPANLKNRDQVISYLKMLKKQESVVDDNLIDNILEEMGYKKTVERLNEIVSDHLNNKEYYKAIELALLAQGENSSFDTSFDVIWSVIQFFANAEENLISPQKLYDLYEAILPENVLHFNESRQQMLHLAMEQTVEQSLESKEQCLRIALTLPSSEIPIDRFLNAFAGFKTLEPIIKYEGVNSDTIINMAHVIRNLITTNENLNAENDELKARITKMENGTLTQTPYTFLGSQPQPMSIDEVELNNSSYKDGCIG